MKTQNQLLMEINRLKSRQKDIEFTLNNKRVTQDDEWRMFVSEIQGEYETNAERIGYLNSQITLLSLNLTV